MNTSVTKEYLCEDVYFPEKSEYSKLHDFFKKYFESTINGIKIRDGIYDHILFLDKDNYLGLNNSYPFVNIKLFFSGVNLTIKMNDIDDLMNFLNDPYIFSNGVASYVMNTNKESFDKCVSVCFCLLDTEYMIKSALKKK
jgi:hypothetical protein